MSEQFAKTGIYMRLSRDDDKAGESMSIENQRIILRKYVEEHGGTVVDEYIDDGFSGTSFNRPDVKRMLQDAQTGKIDTIVVKDLSRFGRNYIQVGQYIDYIFPAYGIRFIAINDHVDTLERSSPAMDMMPIMNVFNEWHAANTSKKIKAVLEAKQRSGVYTGWSYAYGYKAGEDHLRTAVVDGEAASVVRRIFELRARGRSARAIAKILTDDGIENPTHHFTRLDGGKWKRPCKPYWCPQTVAEILKNPVYVGRTVQHRTTSVSYKNHKLIHVPMGEQIVKENAHEAIVSRELWDRVQEINGSLSRGKADGAGKTHALSGLLVCADCGKKLKLKAAKGANACRYSFCCRTYTDLGKKYCTAHRITEREMEQIVLSDIRSMLKGVTLDEEAERERFIRERAKCSEQSRYSDERQLKAHQNRLIELDRLIQAAFEERVLNHLPESVMKGLCETYQREKSAVEGEISRLKARISDEEEERDADEYIRRLRSYISCEKLTREACLRLISFITVGEKSEIDGGREIHVYYRLKNDET